MNSPAVSIIVIVHNTAPWLADCFDSIADQSHQDFELIVVDVASGRRTKRELRRQLRRFTDPTLIVEPDNIGGAAAANTGILSASGDYLFIMDSDDALPRDALSALHRAALDDGLDIAIGRALTLIGETIRPFRYRADMITWGRVLTVESLLERPELTMAPYYWGRLYRRQFLLDHAILMRPSQVFADRPFTCRALQASSRTGVVDHLSYFWRRDHGDRRRFRSITQRSGDVRSLVERVQSYADVDALFDQPDEAAILQYVRLTNLMRMFVHTRGFDDDILRSGLPPAALRYVQSFRHDEVMHCEFLLARHKIQWYLLAHERFDDLVTVLRAEEPTPTITQHGASLEFDYSAMVRQIPPEACRQHRFKVDSITARIGTTGRIDIHVQHSGAMRIEPIYVELKGPTPDLDVREPVIVDSANDGLRLHASFSTRGVDVSGARLRLCFETRGRYSTQAIRLAG